MVFRVARIAAGVLVVLLVPARSPSGSPAASAPQPTVSGTPAAAAATASSAGAARSLAGTPMVDCTVTSTAGTIAARALCGALDVPEDWSDPDGRHISLRVAVVPARADVAAPDGFFALAGGPGDAGTEVFGWLPGVFSDVHATRDIVLVDQRGTGGSNPLVLPPMPDTSTLSQDEARGALGDWADEWLASLDADPSQYTSSVAADDLEAVRVALGYERVDLYGPSYGGTLAQYYIRQHPDRVRTAIMDGATPLDVPVFERMAANSDAALRLLF